MSNVVNLENIRLEKLLRELYTAQKCTFFLEDAMGRVMDQFGFTEQEAIDIVKLLMEKGLISTRAFLPATFLRPKYIRMFPVVLTAKALVLLKDSEEKNKGEQFN